MMVPDRSRDRHSVDFATLSELFGDTDPRIPALATGALDLQRLVFSEAVWRSINNNRTRVYDKLIEVYPEVAWREVKIAGEPIWQFVNRLNHSVHTNAKTRGGGKHKTKVIALQGGEFCLLCGSRDRPQVDHIVAVNLGGPKDDISNLQLLCEKCNAAKSNIADYDIRIALRVLDKECDQLRYRVLLDRGDTRGTGTRGFCEDCGLMPPETELSVVKKSPALSYAYANLKVTCKPSQGAVCKVVDR
jgi:hypothetical protein